MSSGHNSTINTTPTCEQYSEELLTLLTQVEACLNSRPLTAMPSEDDHIEVLTPGNFLIGIPLEALPDPFVSYCSLSPSSLASMYVCRGHGSPLLERVVTEYIVSLTRFTKWHHLTRNAQVGDIVLLQEDNFNPWKWPLAHNYCQDTPWK